jgi:DNA-binding XRE family transcriptional regulator
MSEWDYSDTDIFSEGDPSERGKPTDQDVELWETIRVRLAARRHCGVVAELPRELTRHQLRSAMQLTQHQLAQRLGLTQARVSRIERHPNPQLDLLRVYVRALGGTLHLLVRFEKEDFRLV